MTLNERGGSTIGLVVLVAIIGAAIFAGSQLIPVFWGHYNLKDDIQTVLRFAFVNNPQGTKEYVTEEVTRLLKKYDAQYKPKELKIELRKEDKYLRVQVWYVRPHKVPFVENPKRFYIDVDNRAVVG